MRSQQALRDHANEFADTAAALRFEDTVWWYAGRQAIIRKFLERARRAAPIFRIAEIGCGSGPHLALLAEYGAVTGIERSPVLAERARSRGIAREIVTCDVTYLTGPYDFQLTCLFDVLEHIEDDRAFLQQLNQHARPGHLLLVSVPACPFLFGPHDRLLHHHRRYSKHELEGVLRDSGYDVLHGSFFLFFLFPLAVLSRLIEKARARLGTPPDTVELGVVAAWLNRILTSVLALEAIIFERVRLPIGLWLMPLAKKR